MTKGNPKFFLPTLNSYIFLNVMLLSKNERIMCKRKELINKIKHNKSKNKNESESKSKIKNKSNKTQNDGEQESANLIIMWALHPFGLPPKKRLIYCPQPDLAPCPFYST